MIARQTHRPLPKPSAAQVGGGGQIGQLQGGLGLQLLGQIPCHPHEGLGGASRQADQLQGHACAKAHRGALLGGIGQYHVGIGAPEAKRTHPHHRGPLRIGEGLQAGLHLQLEGGEINRGIGAAAVEAGGQLPFGHAQRRLDQTGYAGGGFGVTQVGLHRSHPTGLPLRSSLRQHRAQGPQLDRVPLAGASAMGLHILGGGGVDAGASKSGAHASDLGPAVGRHHAVAAAIGVDGRTVNHRIDRIAGRLGRSQGLEQHDPGPLRANVAIGTGIKALATAVGRQQTGLAEAHLNAWMNQGLHAPRQGRRRFPPPDAFAGQVNRHQRRGAGRIDREARALEVKEIGDPVGGDAAGVARQHEGFVVGCGVALPRSPKQGAVIGAGDAHEHPHGRAPHQLQGLAPIL